MILLAAIFACSSENKLQQSGVNTDDIVYELNVSSPTYGEYHGDGPIPVTGTVSPANAKLYIEGVLVESNESGEFSFNVPFEKEYEIVELTVPDGEIRERIPVFSGQPSSDTWPGGISARLLQPGMDVLGQDLGAMIDEIGWADQISTTLPSTDWGWLGFTPVGVVNDPTVVMMTGAEDGLAVDFSLQGVGVLYELWYYDWNQQMVVEPMSLTFDEIAIGATAVPHMDENGVLIFSMTEADLTMDAPDVQMGQLQGWVLEWVMQQGFNWIVEPLSEQLLTAMLDGIGELEIGGPFQFESDLMGSTMSLGLDDVYGDPDGLALSLGMAFGDLMSETGNVVVVPTASDAPDAQFAVGIHEGLFQTMLNDQLLGMLSQDLDLGGMVGGIIGSAILSLPGGDEAPDALEGWCVKIDPGTATAVRMQTGIEPLAYLYIPDLIFEVGIKSGPMCDTWLSASLAAEVGLVVKDGSKLGIDLEIAEGAINYYGAEDVSEDEVLPALSGLVQTMMGLLGGMAEFDLADMLGGGSSSSAGIPLRDLSLTIIDSQPLRNEAGERVEGLYSVSLDLWATE